MNSDVFAVVLAAAALHALWNAAVRGGADKRLAMCAVVLGHVPLAVLALVIVEWPARASLPWLVASVVLHTGYQFALSAAYRVGELGHVYPLARGSAPLIVTGVSFVFLGERLGFATLLGVALVVSGVITMGAVAYGARHSDTQATQLALLTGLFIAGYSLVDGVGARLSASPVGYYALMSLINAGVMGAVFWRRERTVFSRLHREARLAFWGGGSASFVAYACVVWAFTHAPLAAVTALRESSIVFALLFGTLLLGERPSRARVCAALVVVAGIVLLRVTRGG